MEQERITLTIDEKEVSVAPGVTVMEAADAAGIRIPRLCYHQNLPPTSACRMCLVEIEGARALMPSCSHLAGEGMVVHTNTEKLQTMRKLILELLLSDHPQDCLTCNRNGDCELQDLAYEYGIKEIRFQGEINAHPAEKGGISIAMDHSKCILCGRCVSACQEVQMDDAIDFIGRGFTTRVDLPVGLTRKESDCVFCGNCVAVCPTGALYPKDAEGLGRAIDLKQVATTCVYCGCGCQLLLHVKDNRIVKVTANPDYEVNHGGSA